METTPLMERRPAALTAAKIALAAALGLCAAALLSSSQSIAVRRSIMVTQGVGAEEENDAMLLNALGPDEGDTTADVQEMTETQVEEAEEATEEAVTQVRNDLWRYTNGCVLIFLDLPSLAWLAAAKGQRVCTGNR
mgnify:CR=1 FL=1|jgi:hypothetical protein